MVPLYCEEYQHHQAWSGLLPPPRSISRIMICSQSSQNSRQTHICLLSLSQTREISPEGPLESKLYQPESGLRSGNNKLVADCYF